MPYCAQLTPKHLETHEYILSTMATDALVLKHQAIINHSSDKIFIVLDQFYTKILHLYWRIFGNEIAFWKKKILLEC